MLWEKKGYVWRETRLEVMENNEKLETATFEGQYRVWDRDGDMETYSLVYI